MPMGALALFSLVQAAAAPSLIGIVVDDAGQPVEGAIVVVAEASPRYDEPLASAVSGADGKFDVGGLDVGRPPYTVLAHAPGYGPYRERDLGPDAFPLRIVLEPGGASISGVVLDGESQEPVAGAIVESLATRAEGRLDAHPRFGRVESVTDAEGRFELRGLGYRPGSVRATAPGYGTATRTGLEPGGSGSVTLYLFEGVGIYGRVLDDAGDPVAGAYLDAEPAERFSSSAVGTSVQTSDAEGRFALLGLKRGGHRVYVRHPDFAPAVEEVVLEADDVQRDIVLASGSRVRGRLVDADGAPIQGRAALQSLDGASIGALVRPRLEAEASVDGAFTLENVPPGDHRLELSARGYASESVDIAIEGRGPGPGQRVMDVDVGDVALEVGLAIHGAVSDLEGNPVRNARLFAFRTAGGQGRGMPRRNEDATGDDGRFVLAGLEAGLHQVSVFARGFAQRSFDAEPGQTPVAVVLEPAGSIRGTVTGPEGRPLSVVVVSARSPDDRRYGGNAEIEEEGRFVVESLAEGTYAVEISAQGFASRVLSDVEVSKGAVTDVGTVRLARGARLRGFVVDAAGAPVAGASVSVRSARRRFSPMDEGVTTDARGHFEIGGLSEARVDLEARHPSYSEGRLEAVPVEEDFVREVEIVLASGGALEGTVRTRDGADTAGRLVQVGPRRGGFRERDVTRTGPDGSFRFEHLPAGTVEVALMASAGGMYYSVQSLSAEIVENETVFVELDSRGILVTGQVRRAGAPLAGAAVDFWPAEGSSMSRFGSSSLPPSPAVGPRYLGASTGESGYFELMVDTPGEYRVSVVVGGVGLPRREVMVPDQDTVLLDIEYSGVAVSGRVIDRETEAPVPGAWVSATPEPRTPERRGGNVQTGADGSFEIEVEPGSFRLAARAEGYATEEERLTVGVSGVSGLALSVDKELRITGRVRTAGRSAGAGAIAVLAVEDVPDLSTPPTQLASSRTVADGSFALGQLSRSRYNILVGDALSGFGFAAGVSAGAEAVELVLRPGGTLDVEVVDSEGSPLAGAAVAVVGIGGRKIRGIQTWTDDVGRATFVVPAGSLQVKAARPGEIEGMASVAVAPGGMGSVRVVTAPIALERRNF